MNFKMRRQLITPFVLILVSCTCAEPERPSDAGHDAGLFERDAGPGHDAGLFERDAGPGQDAGALRDAGTSDDGGADAGGFGCTINGVSFSPDTVNPANPCQTCTPLTSATAWSARPLGTSCGTGLICHAGDCSSGCVIGGAFHAALELNGGCQQCRPPLSTTSWSNINEGQPSSCGSAEICSTGHCVKACIIDGGFVLDGTQNGPCQWCVAAVSTGWSNRTDGVASSCSSGMVCSVGMCDYPCQGADFAADPFARGDGSQANPFVLCSVAQLDRVRTYLTEGRSFALGVNVDLAAVPFSPITDTLNHAFLGTFDGNNHTISGWHYNAPSTDVVGFFASNGNGSTIRNLTLANVDVVGRDSTGAVVGADYGQILGVVASGKVVGRDRVGGVVGRSASSNTSKVIRDSRSAVDVTGNAFVGGLAGEFSASSGAVRCSATGAVSGSTSVGGLVGSITTSSSSAYSVLDSTASGAVVGMLQVGGLVGTMGDASAISRSSATGDVGGVGASKVGGLVGENRAVISDSFAVGAVTGASTVGGLVGFNQGLIADSYSTGLPTGSASTGGLVGSQATGPLVVLAEAVESFWDTQRSGLTTSAGGSGKTTAELNTAATFSKWNGTTTWVIAEGSLPKHRTTPVACVVGAAAFGGGAGTRTNPYLIGQPAQMYQIRCNLSASFKLTADLDFSEGPHFPPLGDWLGPGFSGDFDGNGKTISNLRVYGQNAGLFGATSASASLHDLRLVNVEVGGSYQVGTVVGQSLGSLTNVKIEGGVVRGIYVVGGLAGSASGTTSRCSSSAEVRLTSGYGGGLIGYANSGTLSDSYSMGSVTGGNGLVGGSSGPISRCYAAGPIVRGQGFGSGSPVTSCYWDLTTSGQTQGPGGIGKTDAQMRDATTFVGWDFDTVWQLDAGQLPTLR